MTNNDTLFPLIIAEIGVNYYDIATAKGISPVEAAKLMISEAKRSGAHVAKFQTYKAEKIAASHSPAYWDVTEDTTRSQRELFSKFDKLTIQDYVDLAAHCRREGIEFMSTPFDVVSADFVDTLVARHKIASADITNLELLEKIASFKKPVILSTGASTREEVQTAVNVLRDRDVSDLTLLHCVLCYPTAPHLANLWKIGELKTLFPECRVGYSDHTKFNKDILVASHLLGATVLEKHFTLDKNLKGNDHYHAANPDDFILLRKEFEFIQAVVGKKRTPWYAPEEEPARQFARRGVYLSRDVKKGDKLNPKDVEFLRPSLDGIEPQEWFDFLSRGITYASDAVQGKLLTKTDIS